MIVARAPIMQPVGIAMRLQGFYQFSIYAQGLLRLVMYIRFAHRALARVFVEPFVLHN